MICPKCNHKLPDDSEFCQYCGGNIKEMADSILDAVATAINDGKNFDGMSSDEILESVFDVQTNTIMEVNDQAPPVQRKEKPVKMKFCSRCGAIIDNNTKVCTGCGKQYFKGITKRSIPIIILLVIIIVISAVSVHYNMQLVNEIESQADTIHIQKAKIKKLNNEIEEYESLAQFVDDHVVFIEDDGTNLYHKFECEKYKRGGYVYNVENAEHLDYYPCPECYEYEPPSAYDAYHNMKEND